MVDNTASKALRMFADAFREANLMAVPAKETQITRLTIAMDELAQSLEEIESAHMLMKNNTLEECYPNNEQDYL